MNKLSTMKPFILTFLTLLPSFLFAQQWEAVLPDSVRLHTGFVNEDNSTELVGFSGNDGAYFKVYADGSYESVIFPAPEGKRLVLDALVPLDDGGYFVPGVVKTLGNASQSYLKVMVLDNNLSVVTEQSIQVTEGFMGYYTTGGAVMDDDGTVVLLASAKRNSPDMPGTYEFRGVLYRFAQSGECLNCRYLLADSPDPLCYIWNMTSLELINDPFSNQMIVLGRGQGGVESLLYFDYDFNLTNDFFIDDISFPEIGAGWQCKHVSDPCIGHWLNSDVMLLSATQKDTASNANHPHVLIGKMNREGEIFERVEINKQDTLMYACRMAYANDSTIFVTADCHTESFTSPSYPQVYLINTDLEILGCVSFWDHLDYVNINVFPTNDEGCIMIAKRSDLYYDEPTPAVIRLSREDFHPVWSLEEWPRDEIKVEAWPNPAGEEIHFNLSDIPCDGSMRLQIFNTTGQVSVDRHIQGRGNVLTVGVAALPPGLYTYAIYDKEKTVSSGKFIKT